MRISSRSPLRWILRLAGLALIAGAVWIGRDLDVIGPAHAGHEPAIAYGLALLAFAGGTVGVALALFGRHLFDPVPVSERWVSHLPHDQSGARWS